MPYSYSSPETPPLMTSGIASLECATTGVLFKPTIKKPHLSLVSRTSLEEKLAGQKALRALEGQRNQKRRSLFESQDELDRPREELIARIFT